MGNKQRAMRRGGKEMSNFFEIGGYMQTVHEEEGKITDISCTCKHGSVHRDAWMEGKKVCKHIRQVLINKKKLNENEKSEGKE